MGGGTINIVGRTETRNNDMKGFQMEKKGFVK